VVRPMPDRPDRGLRPCSGKGNYHYLLCAHVKLVKRTIQYYVAMVIFNHAIENMSLQKRANESRIREVERTFSVLCS